MLLLIKIKSIWNAIKEKRIAMRFTRHSRYCVSKPFSYFYKKNLIKNKILFVYRKTEKECKECIDSFIFTDYDDQPFHNEDAFDAGAFLDCLVRQRIINKVKEQEIELAWKEVFDESIFATTEIRDAVYKHKSIKGG